jgi:hypothetical protein
LVLDFPARFLRNVTDESELCEIDTFGLNLDAAEPQLAHIRIQVHRLTPVALLG